MKRFKLPFVDVLRPFLMLILGLTVVAGLFWFRLDSLVPGVSQTESTTVQQVQSRSLSARDILDNPLYLPHQLAQYGLEKLGFTGIFWLRSIGALFGVIAVFSMFFIIKHWHTNRVAVISIILFATSSWLLHSARLATPETTYLLLPLLILIGTRLQQGDHPFTTLSLAAFAGGLMLYVPGMVWFILPGAIWQRKRLLDQSADVNRLWNILLPVGFVILLLPLGYALAADPDLIKVWLGLNNEIVSVTEALKNILKVPVYVFVRGEADPAIGLGRLPLLDVATAAFAVFGAYWYGFHRKLDRTKFVLGGLGLSFVLAGLNGILSSTLLLPFIYLLAAGGITFLLQQWFTVFPRNPLARGVGIGLIVAVVVSASFYHTQRYFVAWPNAPATKQAFSIDQ